MKVQSSHFARSVFTVYVANCVNGVVGLIAVPATLHFLGSEGYGLFSIYAVLVGYVAMADFGIGKNLLARLSRERAPADQIETARTALGLYCWICAGWVVLLPLLWRLIPDVVFPVAAAHRATVQWLILLAISEFVIGVPLSLSQSACVARQEFASYAKYTVLSGMSRQAVLIAAAAAFRSPLALATAMMAKKILDVYLGFRIMGAVPLQVWRPRLALRPALAMLSQSGALSVAQVFSATFTSAGSYLVNARFGLHWLGLYRAAFDLAAKSSVIANGITLVLFPKLASAFGSSGHRKSMRRILQPLLETSWVFYAALGACAVMAAPWVLPFIGIRAPEASGLFVWLVIGLAINCHTLIANEILQADGRYAGNILVNLAGLAMLATIFHVSAGAVGPIAIGIAWIAAAAVSALLADSVILSSLEVPAMTQMGSAAKKTGILILGCATLAPFFRIVPRGLEPLAAGMLLAILFLNAAKLSRKINSSWHPGGKVPVSEEPTVTV